jgi:hypothetical protein
VNNCEGRKGGNVCGRKAELLITDHTNIENVFYSCIDCPGRIIVENDIDAAEVERLYE